MPRRRKLYGVDEVSPAELAWLTGDESKIDPKSWDGFFLYCLKTGDTSHHKGRGITPWQLFEQFGHLVPPKRRQELEAELEEMKYHHVIRAGEMVRELRSEWRQKPPPDREPWVVDFPGRKQ